jgi:hypothetical protein
MIKAAKITEHKHRTPKTSRISPEKLPIDAQFKAYEEVVVQNIKW